MNIRVVSIEPHQFNKVTVKVAFAGGDGAFSNRATVDVHINQGDSLAEIRKQAIEAAREFLSAALAAEPVEAYPLMEKHE